MQKKYRQNISELANYVDIGQLNRKKHWKKYHRTLRVARRTDQEEKDLMILNEIDSFFYESWRVPKIKSFIGVPLLGLAVLIVQLLYIFFLSQDLPFIIGIILFITFSLANFTLSHVIYHWFFGRILGIKFKSIFIFKSAFRKARFPFNAVGNFMPAFGIKYDLFSFLKAKKWKRTVMFISAPILTWIWFGINYLFLVSEYPSEILILKMLGIILMVLFLFTQFLSFYGKGDFYKASRDYK